MDTIEDIVRDPIGKNLRGEKKVYCDILTTPVLMGTIVLATEDGLVVCPEGAIPSGVVAYQEKMTNNSYITSYFKSFSTMLINGDSSDITVGALVYSKGDGKITATATAVGQAFAVCKGNDIVAGTTVKVCKVEVL